MGILLSIKLGSYTTDLALTVFISKIVCPCLAFVCTPSLCPGTGVVGTGQTYGKV